MLNPLGLNSIRVKPVFGTIIWGARTLDGADAAASQWKYLPVRRTALMIEEALFRGTQWAVFEPNDESLWAQLRLNAQSYMHGLFRQGAFQGTEHRRTPTWSGAIPRQRHRTTSIEAASTSWWASHR